jgi:hypothetical protein
MDTAFSKAEKAKTEKPGAGISAPNAQRQPNVRQIGTF